MEAEAAPRALGRRIIVVGPSCSGKSTLASELAVLLGADFVELDALFWKPGWQEPDPEEFRVRILEAHTGESWVTAGNYLRHTRTTIWPHADTVIWLDFPLHLTTWRILARSWRRWRDRELLWGTNLERFWDQLMVWSPRRSLIAYTWARHRRNRKTFADAMRDPNPRFVRLKSPRDVTLLLQMVSRGRVTAGVIFEPDTSGP